MNIKKLNKLDNWVGRPNFEEMYNSISEVFREGKNISWYKIRTKYLPGDKKVKWEIPEGEYKVLYTDPPWSYNDKCEEGAIQSRSTETHYPTMSIDELCEMDMPKTGEDAVLFLWATSPLLEESFQVINAWGFKYKASFVWDKVKHNMGHYNSVRHEFLLICTKGSCTPDNNKLFDSVQSIEKTKIHSQKPDRFYEIIEELYCGKKIELFARKKRKGWVSWGDEI